MINELIIPRPDDMHLHLREGKMLKVVSQHSASQFGRAIIMPNLKNPVINTELAHIYYDEIKKYTKTHQFEPLMTIYFNEGLTLEELKKIEVSSKIIGIKLYPKGVTTNSNDGMDSFESGYKIFEITMAPGAAITEAAKRCLAKTNSKALSPPPKKPI